MKKNILVVTPGLKSKISHLADSFKNLYDAEIVHGQEKQEKKVDRVLKIFKKGAIYNNKINLNKKILSLCKESNIDLLIIIKGLNIDKELLMKLKSLNPRIKIINWTCDDLALAHNQSQDFIESAPIYDLIYTSKSENIKNNELIKLGFKKVIFYYQRFSKKYHRKPSIENIKTKYDVFFAGYAEEERFQYMNYLAKNGVIVDVFGNGWNKLSYKLRKHKNLKIHYKPVVGNEYSLSIFTSTINLCFLRVLNRDIHTARSVEIPACGGFMLGQRTEEHDFLFKEGKEADYFSTKKECLEKVKYYINNINIRSEIAENGYLRTRNSDYSYDSLAKEIFSEYLNL
jgi:hypothetical protein